MLSASTVLLTTALHAIVVKAVPALEQFPAPTPTQALQIRSLGNVGLLNADMGLDKRVQLIAFIGAAPLFVLGTATFGLCYRLPSKEACYAVVTAVIAIALIYGAVWWWYFINREQVQSDMDLENQGLTLEENRAKSTARPEVLESEKSERRYTKEERETTAWKTKMEKKRRSWQDPLKNYLQVYEHHEDVPEIKEKLDSANEKLELAETAWEKFITADEVSTTLRTFRKRKKGTLSERDVNTLIDEATNAVYAVQDKAQELLNQHKNYLNRLEELPFFKEHNIDGGESEEDDDDETTNLLPPRGLDKRMARLLGPRGLGNGMPRLLKEETENCDTKLCRRHWISSTLPKGRKRGQISAKDMIHNFYSTPADFHFEDDRSHRSIIRRDSSDDEGGDDDDDDDVVNCENEFVVDDLPILSRISLVQGNDTDSLGQIVDSLLQDFDQTEQGLKDAALKANEGKLDLDSGQWQCLNADGDNGGDWAIRGVAIFTSNPTLLHADTAPMLSRCMGLL